MTPSRPTAEPGTRSQRRPTAHPVCPAADIPAGGRAVVTLAGKRVGVFNVRGTFVAILDVCPHEVVPICAGRVGGTTLPSPPGEYRWGREGEILSCPWHGWEFDLLTGKALAHRTKHLRRFPVSIRDGQLYVHV